MKSKFGSFENQKEDDNTTSLLDLPELTLECILDRLSPAGLCAMAGVCSSLRDRCTSDHLWEKHMKRKWGRVIGDSAYREWQWHIASKMRPRNLLDRSNQKGLIDSISRICPFLSKPRAENGEIQLKKSDLPVNSIMAWYLSLETGEFWFPAQVYNRENGHAGFMLSCYDANLSYDSKTDTFQARYSPHGRQTAEENISWDRLRAPPVDTCSYDLHISDSLVDLRPGDHIEIQWRKTKEFPYGWWYGVVGHMDSCDGNENHCRCQYTDTVTLEFKQYPASSRWRKTAINRKDHREVGNEVDGFYGGIRKLYKEEISKWKRLWPKQALE
ncbi:F-box protein [Hibiscus syriacus]|uniref:F-box protein n=1 Tax=Hibiscus syriacus TaxID=106335 RepID=A0A6A3CHY2_HIBSY|nr:F-box protein At2g41170-like [Hibiscus syriacus]KAE8728920.1 F-box protein [Hibiscus syriacus]